MKKIFIFTFLMVTIISMPAIASVNTFETKEDAYARRSYENYNTYKQNNYNAPLGGYNRPLNDDGGRYYGERQQNQNQGFNNLNNNNNSNRQNNNFNSYGF